MIKEPKEQQQEVTHIAQALRPVSHISSHLISASINLFQIL